MIKYVYEYPVEVPDVPSKKRISTYAGAAF